MRPTDARGSILIPALVGVFIVAVLATSLVDTMSLNLREAGQVREIVNLGQAVDRVLNLLRDPGICTANFRDLAASGANVARIKTNSSGPDQIEISVGDFVPARTTQLRALRLRDFRAYQTGAGGPSSRGTMEFDLVFEPPTGGISRRRAILIGVDLGASGRVQTCVALGRAADFWQLTPASDIWYPGAVAIGDVRVPADYRLYIAGYLQSQDFYHVSDRRRKTDVRGLRADDRLARIRGVRYRWRADGTPAVGVLAQDVARAYPSAVRASGPRGSLTVETDQLVAPLVEKIRALARGNRELEARLARLSADSSP